MIIVVSSSFEVQCAGNKDPETDGGPSEQSHIAKGHQSKSTHVHRDVGCTGGVSIFLSVISKDNLTCRISCRNTENIRGRQGKMSLREG